MSANEMEMSLQQFLSHCERLGLKVSVIEFEPKESSPVGGGLSEEEAVEVMAEVMERHDMQGDPWDWKEYAEIAYRALKAAEASHEK